MVYNNLKFPFSCLVQKIAGERESPDDHIEGGAGNVHSVAGRSIAP